MPTNKSLKLWLRLKFYVSVTKRFYRTSSWNFKFQIVEQGSGRQRTRNSFALMYHRINRTLHSVKNQSIEGKRERAREVGSYQWFYARRVSSMSSPSFSYIISTFVPPSTSLYTLNSLYFITNHTFLLTLNTNLETINIYEQVSEC